MEMDEELKRRYETMEFLSVQLKEQARVMQEQSTAMKKFKEDLYENMAANIYKSQYKWENHTNDEIVVLVKPELVPDSAIELVDGMF